MSKILTEMVAVPLEIDGWHRAMIDFDIRHTDSPLEESKNIYAKIIGADTADVPYEVSPWITFYFSNEVLATFMALKYGCAMHSDDDA